MSRSLGTLLGCLLLAGNGCGDGETTDGAEGGASTGATATTTTTEGPSTTAPTLATMSGEASTAGDSSSGETSATVTGSATSTGETSTVGTTGASSSGDEGSGSSSGTTGGVVDCTEVKRQPFDFSYLWVANSPEGTVSKIDTQGAVELGRYISGPPGATDPSRTSVSADGRYAVVVNRSGGITMIAADEDECIDSDISGTIETSSGPADVLDWEADECVLWNVPLPGTGNTGPRPVSWTIGEQDPVTCEYAIGDVWVGWYDQPANQGNFRLLDGTTGATLDDVAVPDWSGENWGPYGGAITAGLFLQEFVAEGLPWAHLDIAGPAFSDSVQDTGPKGGTGYAVRTLLSLISNFTKPEA